MMNWLMNDTESSQTTEEYNLAQETEATGRKSVLYIAYHYPPAGGIAGMRVFQFSRYLQQLGVKPIVLSVTKKAYYDVPLDNSLLEMVKDFEIVRTPMPLLPKKLDLVGKISSNKTSLPKKFLNKLYNVSVLRLAKFIRRSYNAGAQRIKPWLFPDAMAPWLPSAVRMGTRLVREKGVDCILTTCPAHTTTLIGLLIKKRTGVKWIADFRDQWVGNPNPHWKQRGFYQLWLAKHYERQVIKLADLIITTNDHATADFLNRYPDFPKEKFVTVFNGYDEEVFERLTREEREPNKRNLRIKYIGSIGFPRFSKTFAEALAELKLEKPEISEHLKVTIVGNIQRACADFIKESGANIDILYHQPYETAIKEMFDSDVLVVFEHPSESRGTALVSKIFEYIGAGKFVLGVCPEGANSSFIKKHDLGIVVPFDDKNAIKEALVKIWEMWHQGELANHIPRSKIDQFKRGTSAKQLKQLIDNLLIK